MNYIIRALVALIFIAIPTVSSAKTIEVKSKNFVFIGDVREKNARALIIELEQYRTALTKILNVPDEPEIIPVRIYSAKNAKRFEEITGQPGAAGIYKATLDGPVFILNSKNGFKRGKEARRIALHEFTHHIVATHTNLNYPLWYNEGLANYFSTFEVNRKGHLVIGNPYQPYGYVLSAKQWLPTEIIVRSIRNYPFKNFETKRGRLGIPDFFYAQSWLAVHYIQSEKGELDKLNTYVKLLNSSPRPKNMFEQSFGVSPSNYHAKLRAYHKANRYAGVTIDPAFNINSNPIQSRELDEGMAAFHKAEAMRFFSAPSIKTAVIESEYDKVAALIGETPDVLSARADLANWENQYDKAIAYIDQALKIAPNSALVNRTAGLVYMYKNNNPNEDATMSEIEIARKHLETSIKLNPNDIGAHYYYARTYFISDEPPTPQAIQSAKKAIEYYKDNNFINENLALAHVLISGDKPLIAKPAVSKAVIWGSNSGIRRWAQRLYAEINYTQ